MADKLIGNKEAKYKIVSGPPDFCVVGGQTVPFDISRTCDKASTASPNVNARDRGVLRVGDEIAGVSGNAGAGVASGTSQKAGKNILLTGSINVRANGGVPLARDRSEVLMNVGVAPNTVGKLHTGTAKPLVPVKGGKVACNSPPKTSERLVSLTALREKVAKKEVDHAISLAPGPTTIPGAFNPPVPMPTPGTFNPPAPAPTPGTFNPPAPTPTPGTFNPPAPTPTPGTFNPPAPTPTPGTFNPPAPPPPTIITQAPAAATTPTSQPARPGAIVQVRAPVPPARPATPPSGKGPGLDLPGALHQLDLQILSENVHLGNTCQKQGKGAATASVPAPGRPIVEPWDKDDDDDAEKPSARAAAAAAAVKGGGEKTPRKRKPPNRTDEDEQRRKELCEQLADRTTKAESEKLTSAEKAALQAEIERLKEALSGVKVRLPGESGGAFGERNMDEILGAALEKISVPKHPNANGIDGIFKSDGEPPTYFLVESKFGSSTLATKLKDGKQMSGTWIHGCDSDFDRLFDAVNDPEEAEKIRRAYEDGRVVGLLVHTETGGKVTIQELDQNGAVIGPFP